MKGSIEPINLATFALQNLFFFIFRAFNPQSIIEKLVSGMAVLLPSV